FALSMIFPRKNPRPGRGRGEPSCLSLRAEEYIEFAAGDIGALDVVLRLVQRGCRADGPGAVRGPRRPHQPQLAVVDDAPALVAVAVSFPVHVRDLLRPGNGPGRPGTPGRTRPGRRPPPASAPASCSVWRRVSARAASSRTCSGRSPCHPP